MQGLYTAAAVVGIIFATAIVYAAGSFYGWWVHRYTVDELVELLEPSIRVYAPEGPGPFPAVLQLHGCGGAKPIQDDYARAARDEGALVVILDSLTPRGIDESAAVRRVCSGRILRGRERAGDLVAGLEIVRRRSDVDDTRIAVAGWSHGGWTIMDLLAMNTPAERPYNLTSVPDNLWAGVVGVQLIYPYAGFPALTRSRGWSTTDIPVDALVLEGDTVANPAHTMEALAKASEAGAEIDIDIWDGVTHAFEEEVHAEGSTLVYSPERSAEAHRRYAAWVKKTLGL